MCLGSLLCLLALRQVPLFLPFLLFRGVGGPHRRVECVGRTLIDRLTTRFRRLTRSLYFLLCIFPPPFLLLSCDLEGIDYRALSGCANARLFRAALFVPIPILFLLRTLRAVFAFFTSL